jgi:hypothetical protein
MVPKLFPAGKSFKTLGAYLLHDPHKAQSTERIRWTHTLNLAFDDPASAIDEMLWTARGASALKQQAQVRSGGRSLENPVKHFSLNWHPSETPSREQMIEATESFLKHMRWNDHQALLVCHDDKHPHVHVMLNAVHPETGRAIETSFEKRRAQEWAIAYEREHGRILCEERLKPKEEREASPTRAAWEKMKKAEREHDRAEYARIRKDFDYFARNDSDKGDRSEWAALKQQQRDERLSFFMEGKQAYRDVRNAVFREVREQFRDRWRQFYQDKPDGVGARQLADTKADILALQGAALEGRRTEACAELREQRDQSYTELLARQKAQRAELRSHQAKGVRSPHLLSKLYAAERIPAPGASGVTSEAASKEHSRSFRRTAKEICEPASSRSPIQRHPGNTPPGNRARVRDGLDAVGGIGLGVLGAIATIGERLFDGFFGGGETVPEPPHAAKPKHRDAERDEAKQSVAAQRTTESQAAEAARLQQYWDERRHRKRERD